QLKSSTDFMKSHRGLTKFITITIGANDIHRCNTSYTECLNHLINNLNNIIIPKLKDAGGEDIQYAASLYYFHGHLDNGLSDGLTDVYSKNGFKVVDLRTIITSDTKCNYTYCNYHNPHPNKVGQFVIGEHFHEKLTEFGITNDGKF
ncbi:13463_t:CDS:1, partial [Dentiscutata erythropus]